MALLGPSICHIWGYLTPFGRPGALSERLLKSGDVLDHQPLTSPDGYLRPRETSSPGGSSSQYFCNLLRPLITILFLLVPYGYIIIKIKKNS